MKLKAVIFDFDGTLANSLPVCFKAIGNALLAFTGRQYSDQEIQDMFGPSEKGIVQGLVPEDQWEECYAMVKAEYEKAHYLCPAPAPGITDMLEMLKARGVKLGIITGKGRETCEISLKYTGIAPYFDTIETGSPHGVVKSDAMTEMLAQWGIPKDEAVYVGDAVYDVTASLEADVVPIGAAWLHTADAVILREAGAEIIFETVDEFTKWLQERT